MCRFDGLCLIMELMSDVKSIIRFLVRIFMFGSIFCWIMCDVLSGLCPIKQ